MVFFGFVFVFFSFLWCFSVDLEKLEDVFGVCVFFLYFLVS